MSKLADGKIGKTRKIGDESGKSLADRKLFIGPRLRRIRRELGQSQTQMAERLGISPSYVNLIERNQRPVTAQILLRMAEVYDVDLRGLAAGDDDRSFAELNEVFSDPLFRAAASCAANLARSWIARICSFAISESGLTVGSK